MTSRASTPRSLDALRDWLSADLAHTAVFLDFDGTIAPIVDHPAAARPIPGMVEVLEQLRPLVARLAVVSGRPRSFLVAQLPADIDLYGLYGLEGRIGGVEVDHAGVEPWRRAVDAVVSAAHGLLAQHPGVIVEAKGTSLTVHFRGDPAAEPAVEAWCQQWVDRHGFERRPARQSVELHPAVVIDKGTVVQELSGDAPRAVYFGDDIGDLAAFDALARLADEGRSVAAVAVASAELPPLLAEAADVVIDGPAVLLGLLHALLPAR